MTILVEKPKQAVEHLKRNSSIERYRIGDAAASIRLKKAKDLLGEEKIFVDQVSDGSIIKIFDKTAFPQNPSDVVCPHFLELKWANGCYYDCAWCYLNGTFRFLERSKNPFLKDKKKIVESIESLFIGWETPVLLNSGELADSLVFEGHEFSFSKDIIPLFKKQKTHKLLILTKSSNVEGILDSDSQDVIITSFSLNAYPVSERWENRAPHPRERIKAAQKLFKGGYQVRIRIDPIVPIEGWKNIYLELVDDIFSSFYPERITLGSLRGLQSTINNCKDKTWVKYLSNKRGSNWGKKIEDELRMNIYSTIIGHLESRYSYDSVALCKETVSMWGNIHKDYKLIKCNCIL